MYWIIFFSQCKVEEVKMVIDIINGNHLISLRFLDWFVTRYCYLYKLSIPIDNPYNKEKTSNVNISYKAQLKSFKKRYFDPFRRKNKFNYNFNNYKLDILTTLGQLNFFRWVLSFDIIKYVEENFDTINKKITHVNSYFKKNIIDTNSITLTTSEEHNRHTDKSMGSITDPNTNDDSSTNDNSTYNSTGKNKSNKKTNTTSSRLDHNADDDIKKYNLKKNKYQPSYKYPQVMRNICIEF